MKFQHTMLFKMLTVREINFTFTYSVSRHYWHVNLCQTAGIMCETDSVVIQVHHYNCFTPSFNWAEMFLFLCLLTIAKKVVSWMRFKGHTMETFLFSQCLIRIFQVSLVKNIRMAGKIFSSREIIESDMRVDGCQKCINL